VKECIPLRNITNLQKFESNGLEIYGNQSDQKVRKNDKEK